jgi:hypothetical protein
MKVRVLFVGIRCFWRALQRVVAGCCVVALPACPSVTPVPFAHEPRAASLARAALPRLPEPSYCFPAASHVRSLPASSLSRTHAQASSILDSLDGAAAKPYMKRIAKHFADVKNYAVLSL